MRSTWREDYPGDLLTDESIPAPRHWSLTFHMIKSGNANAYDVWTKITPKAEEDLLEA